MDKSMIYPKKNNNIHPMVRPILPPHDEPALLPTPNIPPLYGVVPPPFSYREKRPISHLVQPMRPQSNHPTTKDENIPPSTNIPPS